MSDFQSGLEAVSTYDSGSGCYDCYVMLFPFYLYSGLEEALETH